MLGSCRTLPTELHSVGVCGERVAKTSIKSTKLAKKAVAKQAAQSAVSVDLGFRERNGPRPCIFGADPLTRRRRRSSPEEVCLKFGK
jgi:hypothetical protein